MGGFQYALPHPLDTRMQFLSGSCLALLGFAAVTVARTPLGSAGAGGAGVGARRAITYARGTLVGNRTAMQPPHACMICLSCAYSCVLPSTCTCSIGYWRPSRAVFSCDRKRLMGNMSSGGNQAGGTFVCSCMLFKVCLIVLSIRSASDGVLKEAPKPQVTRCCILTHTCAGDLVFMVTLFPLSGHVYRGGATF